LLTEGQRKGRSVVERHDQSALKECTLHDDVAEAGPVAEARLAVGDGAEGVDLRPWLPLDGQVEALAACSERESRRCRGGGGAGSAEGDFAAAGEGERAVGQVLIDGERGGAARSGEPPCAPRPDEGRLSSTLRRGHRGESACERA